MQRHRATVSVGFVTGMLSGLNHRDVDAEQLLHSLGMSTEGILNPRVRMPIDQYVKLYNLVVRSLDDEGFGLFSSPLRLGTFEFLCRSVLSSATLEEALDRASRFLRIVLPELAVSVTRGRATALIEIAEILPLRERKDDPCRVFAFEWLLRLLHGLSCWLVGRGLQLNSVTFPFPKPPHAADYSLIYTQHSGFNSRSLVVSLTPNLLDLPIRRDEDALSVFLKDAPGKITMLYRRDRETVRRVRDMVAVNLSLPNSIEEVANKLHVSARTLHRRLQEEGSSFRAIKDAVRRDFALSRLEKTRQSVERIATDLGYSEPSAFFRAFQSWTGTAPSKYRKRLA